MHITTRVVAGLPELRRPEVRRRFKQLLGDARLRGVRTVAFALMDDHIHWLVVADSKQALHDATRYVLSQLARRLNRLWRRRGPLLADRYWSVCCRNVRQAFHALGYVMRNSTTAGCFLPGPDGFDRYVGVDEALLAGDRFLRSVVGPTPRVVRAMLRALADRPVRWRPMVERLQMRLPGT